MEEGMATLATSTAQRQAAIERQLEQVDLATKDKDTAFLLELLAGLVGFLGIGYFYTGLTNAALVRLIGYWVFLGLIWTAFWTINTVTACLASCLVIVPLAVQVVVPYFSANELKKGIEAVKSGTATPGASGGASTFGGYLDTPEESAAPTVTSTGAGIYESPVDTEMPRRDEEDNLEL